MLSAFLPHVNAFLQSSVHPLVRRGIDDGNNVRVQCRGFLESRDTNGETSGTTPAQSSPPSVTPGPSTSVAMTSVTRSSPRPSDKTAPESGSVTASGHTDSPTDPMTPDTHPTRPNTPMPTTTTTLSVTTHESRTPMSIDNGSPDHFDIASIVVSSVGTVLTLILCIGGAVIFWKKFGCRRLLNYGRRCVQVQRALNIPQQAVDNPQQAVDNPQQAVDNPQQAVDIPLQMLPSGAHYYSNLPESYHPYELLDRSVASDVSDYLRIVPARAESSFMTLADVENLGETDQSDGAHIPWRSTSESDDVETDGAGYTYMYPPNQDNIPIVPSSRQT
ncbi:hypothetical protein ScPMuIL_013183 [Solemya velum]